MLLLTVYLPAFLLASFHIHAAGTVETDCADCAQQVPHVGHLLPARAALHDCALCQFLVLAYVAVPALTLTFIRPRLKSASVTGSEALLLRTVELPATRAPPFVGKRL